MTNERRALFYALAAVALWSTVATGFKLGLRVLEPVQLLFLGSLLASAIFVLAAVPAGWPRRHLNWREGVFLGLLNPVFYYLVLFEAYDRLPAHIAQPLNYTWAITLAVLAIPILGQKLSPRLILGILVSYGGVVVLLSGSWQSGSSSLDVGGIALAMGSTVVWAIYWLLNARSKTPPECLMATSFSFAVPVLAMLCWLGPGWPALTKDVLIYSAWVGIAEMGVAYLCWQRALRLTGRVARLGQLIFLSPFISLLIIGAVLNEPVGVTAWIGLAVILVGVWLSQTTSDTSPV